MKRKKTGFHFIAVFCAALGWWGLLYPELTLTPDTVKVICDEENGEAFSSDGEWDPDGSLYLELLCTDRSNIRLRSRFFTELRAFWEAFHGTD